MGLEIFQNVDTQTYVNKNIKIKSHNFFKNLLLVIPGFDLFLFPFKATSIFIDLIVLFKFDFSQLRKKS